jgi:integrase
MTSRSALKQSTNWVAQPNDVRVVDPETREHFIIAEVKLGDAWVILGRYKDDRWPLIGMTTNTPEGRQFLDFTQVPACFRAVIKEVLYRYMRRGINESGRPAPSTVHTYFSDLLPFTRYLATKEIGRFLDVTPLVCTGYVHAVKAQRNGRGSKPLAKGTLRRRFQAVEFLCKLGSHTSEPMCDPWPDSAAVELAGTRRRHGSAAVYRTALIPDAVFTTLFQRAWSMVQGATRLLDLRDQINVVARENECFEIQTVQKRQHERLELLGWTRGIQKLAVEVLQIRTACYVVIASLSGCRSHEMLSLHSSSWYSTEDDEGVRYWWMRSRSQKTDAGLTEWMIPEAAVDALKVMDRWSAPHRQCLAKRIDKLRSLNPLNPAIAKATTHLDAIFVAYGSRRSNHVQTVSANSVFRDLGNFAKACGLDWALASHQFRRKFAEYAARSQFGDLRYLRVHFKHWSMDMTLGYGLNEEQDYSLYIEIQDEWDDLKVDVVGRWLDPSARLAGGYGRRLMDWRIGNGITLFKDRKQMVLAIAHSTSIRSNGHAWCTADDNNCVGNDIERSRCGAGCENAVIGGQHAVIYQGLYDALEEVLQCDDIGPGGTARVVRDLERNRVVLKQLGHDPVSSAACAAMPAL